MAAQQAPGELYNVILSLQQMGFYDVILPFLLVFSISYAVLQKVRIFGDAQSSKNVNVIVALVIGFLFLQNQYLVFILQRFLPNVSIIIIVALMFLLLLGVFFGPTTRVSGSATTLAFLFSIIAIIVALTEDFFPGFSVLDWLYILDPRTQTWIIFLAIIIIAISFVVRQGQQPGQGQRGGNYLDRVARDFAGPGGRN